MNIGWDWRPNAYFRWDGEDAPYNLVFSPYDADGNERDVRGLETPLPQFTYGELPEGMGQDIGGVSVAYPPSFRGRESIHVWDLARIRQRR